MSELQMQGVAWSCPNCAELEREREMKAQLPAVVAQLKRRK